MSKAQGEVALGFRIDHGRGVGDGGGGGGGDSRNSSDNEHFYEVACGES